MSEVGESQKPDGLEEALKVAFKPAGGGAPGAGPGPEDRGGSSVLARLEERLGSAPRILLPTPPEDPGAAAPPIKPPSTPTGAGRYQVAGQIAEGGVGVILHARDVDLGREVALKLLRPDHARVPDVLQRFVEEAQIGGQLQHPGIVPVYELGLAADGRPFFAMKLVRGRTLAALLAERAQDGRDDPGLLRVFLRVCETVAYAHARSVIHRDLKPSNVMVGAFGEVQVVDWGMAKVLKRGGIADERSASRPAPAVEAVETVRTDRAGSDSRLGSVMGTLAYMPPEQAAGHVDLLDERADVFALGAILCELLTGEPPYVAGDETLIVQALRGKTEGALGRLAACGADRDLVDLATRCLSVALSERPRHAGQVADAVSRHLSSLEARARTAEIAAAEAGVKAHEERKRRRLAVALAATVVAAGVLGGGGYVVYENRRREAVARGTQAARNALGEARTLEGGARASAPTDVEPWEKAAVAARQAANASPDAEESVKQEITATLGRIERGRSEAIAAAARARKDREMVARLEEFRLLRGDALDPARILGGYPEAFAEYGIPIQAGAEEDAADRIRKSDISRALCGALDDWALAVERYSEESAKMSKRLLKVATLADSDPWRAQVRAAIAANDGPALEKIAAAADPAAHDVAALTVAADALAARTTPRAGIAFLKRVHATYPNDFWVNFLLGAWLAEPATNSSRITSDDSPPQTREGEERAAVLDAKAYLLVAQAVRPSSREVRHQLGMALVALGEWKPALEVWNAALRLHPDYYHMWGHKYDTLKQTGGLEEEAADLRAACDAPGATATQWMRLGIANRVLQKSEESRKAFEKAIQLDATIGQAYYGLGWQQVAAGRNVDAERTYAALAKLQPGNLEAWKRLGAQRERNRDYAGAVEAFESARRIDPYTARSHVDLARVLSLADRLDDALAVHENLRGRFPDTAQVAELEIDLAIALDNAGRAPEGVALAEHARAVLERRVAAQPGDGVAALYLGYVTFEHFHEYEEAIASFVRLEADPAVAWTALLYRGEACIRKGDFDGAVDAYSKHSERYPMSPAGILGIADVRIRQGRYEEALEILSRSAAKFPRTVNVHYKAAWACQTLGRADEALVHMRAVLAFAPDHAWANFQAGVLCVSSGSGDEGLGYLRRFRHVASWPKGRKPSLEQWEDTCGRLARLGRGIDDLRQGTLVTDDPEDARLAGTLCWERGEYRPALRWFERAVRDDPSAGPHFLPYQEAWLVEEAAGYCAGTLATEPAKAGEASTEDDRRAWRKAAARHLRAGIAVWEQVLDAGHRSLGPADVIASVRRYRWWPSLTPLREPAEVERLPEDERPAWRDLWEAVSRLDRRAHGYR